MAKRRSNREGSIYRRKDGRWVAQVTVNGHLVYKYFRSQGDCRNWIKEMQAKIKEGLTLEGTKTTMGEFLDHWLSTAQYTVRPKTWNQYSQVVRQHILPSLGNIKLSEIRVDQIQSLCNIKLKGGTSPRLVRLIHAVIRRALNYAMQMGLIGRNPALAVTKPILRKKEMKTLTEVEVRTLLLAVKDTRYEALYHLAVTTGLRQGELLGLRWSDLDWKARRLKVQRQLQLLPKTGFVFSEPKSAAGRRSILVGPATVEKLQAHFQRQQIERRILGERWKENELIFPSVVGTPMEWRNLVRHFKGILKKAGLPNIRFHDLRHTAATLMLQQGIHPKIVQERLGHSQINLTLDTYSHVLPDMQEEVAEKMDEMFTLIDVSSEIKPLPNKKRSSDKSEKGE
jgi:integrase